MAVALAGLALLIAAIEYLTWPDRRRTCTYAGATYSVGSEIRPADKVRFKCVRNNGDAAPAWHEGEPPVNT